MDDKTKHGFLIDPGAQGPELADLIRRNGWTIDGILLTHGHFDHFGAVEYLVREFGMPVYAYENSAEYLMDPQLNLSLPSGSRPMTVPDFIPLRDGDTVHSDKAPSISLEVHFTPGHARNAVYFYDPNEKVAFVGDTIFQGGPGTSGYPGGNERQLMESIGKILSLPDDTTLLSGHSAPTTVGEEKPRYRFR
ncbi:MAG: MBL fold metallo-hydrolase [Clostridia bacterium]|nr:MBL fold metallo-hydrolase [Clostridia bacterium]